MGKYHCKLLRAIEVLSWKAFQKQYHVAKLGEIKGKTGVPLSKKVEPKSMQSMQQSILIYSNLRTESYAYS